MQGNCVDVNLDCVGLGKANVLSDQSIKVATTKAEKTKRLQIQERRSDGIVSQPGGKRYSKRHPDGIGSAWRGHHLVYESDSAPCRITTMDSHAL